jgi:branched-chain amino acid transport system substrate-binding protein
MKFVEAYKKEYNQVPDALAALAWDAALMVVEGIKKAGPDADPIKIKDAIAATKGLKGVTGTITLNERHDPVKSAVIIAHKKGKLVYQETVNPYRNNDVVRGDKDMSLSPFARGIFSR